MKEQKKLKKTLVRLVWALLMALAVAAALKLFSLFGLLRMMNALPAELPATSMEEPVQGELTISDEELEQLLNGELSFDSLTAQGTADDVTEEPEQADSAPQEEPANAESTPAKETPAASGKAESTAVSTKAEETPASSTQQGTSSAASSKAPAAEKPQESGYEAEVKALVQQAYALKATAENGLNASIASAKAEYKALPESQQTQTRKIMICLSKAGELTALQSYCDKEMDRIVSQLRKTLKENGQSTALADQVMSTYKAEKNRRYTELTNKLYHGS